MSETYKILSQELALSLTGGNVLAVVDSSGPLRFVAVGSYASAYSTDGLTWTRSAGDSLAIYMVLTSVAYGDGKVVAVANSSNLPGQSNLYSTDGVTWELSEISDSLTTNSQWQSVTYGDGKFVAVANYGNTGEWGAYSTDGITWTLSSSMPEFGWSSVTYGDGKFVAISSYFDSAYSTDGITWTSSVSIAYHDWRSVAYGDGKFVAVAFYADSAYSTDGITWTLSSSLPIASWASVAYSGTEFVAVANNDNNASAYSTDGITWTSSDLTFDAWNGVTYGGVKVLGELAGLQAKVIYTVPENKQAAISSISLINSSDEQQEYFLGIVKEEDVDSSFVYESTDPLITTNTISLGQTIIPSRFIASKDVDEISGGITLSSGDQIRIYSESSDLIIHVYGVEIE